jgi:beta-lactamase class C
VAEQRAGQPARSPSAALAVLQEWLEAGLSPGLAMVVARDGRVLAELYGGGDGERPIRPETLFPLEALTMPLTACTALALIEDGLRALDEPLADLLPELADEDRAAATLRRLLTHTTGLPHELGPEERERIGPTPTLADIVGQIGRTRPICPPGSQVRVSQLNYLLLALVVERLAGEPFAAYLQRRVLDAVGLTQTLLGPADDGSRELARMHGTEDAGQPQELYNSDWWRRLALPSAGAYATARDVARFLTACLAEHPPADFLSAGTLELMTRAQTGDLSGSRQGVSAWPRADWGFGFELRGDKRLHPFGELTSPETFGQLSMAGGMAWADPDRGLVCVLLTNHLLEPELARRLITICRFSNAVAAALGE